MERIEYQRMAELEHRFWWYRALHADMRLLLQQAGLPPTAAVLDAGCGTGGQLQLLERCFPSWRFAGLEFDREATLLARGKAFRVPVVQGSVAALPFADAAFDAVLSTDVLYHRNVDEAAALAEFHRCLKPGGRLLLSLPAYEWLRAGHDVQVHTARRYTAGGLRRTLAAAGFAPVRTGYRNSLLFPLMLMHRLGAGRRSRHSDVRPLPGPLNELFYTVTALERRLARFGLRLPFGGSVWALATKA